MGDLVSKPADPGKDCVGKNGFYVCNNKPTTSTSADWNAAHCTCHICPAKAASCPAATATPSPPPPPPAPTPSGVTEGYVTKAEPTPEQKCFKLNNGTVWSLEHCSCVTYEQFVNC